MNTVCLLGRLCKDIEQNDKGTVGSFTLAVDRKFSKEKETDFIRCKVFGETLEIMSKFLGKGSLVTIDGRIQTGSYEKDDGTKVFTTDVIVVSFSFAGGKKDDGDNKGFEVLEDDPEELPF